MISIVIPARNRQHNLYCAVKSIIQQTYKDFEVIVVDYGGEDDTKQMLDSFSDSRIRYIYVDEKGIWNLPRARNVGIRNSTGELIICVDADMVLAADVLERVYADFRIRKDPVLYQIHRRDILPDGSMKLYEPMDGVGAFPGCFQACSRGSWFAVRGFDERLCGYGYEDGDLAVRMRRIDVQQYWMPIDVKIYHQYHKESPAMETYVNMMWSKLNHSHQANDIDWGSAVPRGDAPRVIDKFLIWAVIKPIKAVKKFWRENV